MMLCKIRYYRLPAASCELYRLQAKSMHLVWSCCCLHTRIICRCLLRCWHV